MTKAAHASDGGTDPGRKHSATSVQPTTYGRHATKGRCVRGDTPTGGGGGGAAK